MILASSPVRLREGNDAVKSLDHNLPIVGYTLNGSDDDPLPLGRSRDVATFNSGVTAFRPDLQVVRTILRPVDSQLEECRLVMAQRPELAEVDDRYVAVAHGAAAGLP